MKVLLLDDEASHRLMERRALRGPLPQAKILECATVDEALKTLEQGPFGLVVVDLNIAGSSGLTIVQRLRASISLDDLPIIVLSTSQLAQDIEQSYRAGASAYLFKSDSPEEFLQNLQRSVVFFTAAKHSG